MRAITSLLLIVFASQSNAQGCPDFYRFVDFGLEGRDGSIYRGGPVFRAEDFDGEPLLIWGRTQCLNVLETSRDGPGNPIPVVTSIDYNPDKIGVDFSALRVAAVKEAHAAAQTNTRDHLASLKAANTTQTRGSNYLCVSVTASPRVSCQLNSPFPNNAPLIVYCDDVTCTMPVLVVAENLVASAVWKSDPAYASAKERAGPDISDKVQKIFDFLVPLSAAL
ncbi:MAG: hypothetical protein KJP02_11645 [Octadecabacter sp.]|nr:hypothetical protein [Octadecabacter sp.]